MKKTYIASIMLVLLSKATCDDEYSYEDTDEIDSAPSPDSTSWRLNLQGSLRQRMTLNLAIAHTGQSMVCSPISALFPLGKLLLGSTGSCKIQLNDAIGVSSSSELRSSFRSLLKDMTALPGVRLSISSRVYLSKEYHLRSQFEEDAKDIFKSSIKRINLTSNVKVASRINKWVFKKTEGMIPEIIYPNDIASDALLILVNAVYFSGAWKDKFDTIGTKDFYTATSTRKVEMMSRTGRYSFTKNDALDCQVIKIPYEGEQSSLVIFLPNRRDGLPILLYKLKLAPELMQIALDKMKSEFVTITMPKFKTTTDINLENAYGKVGLTDIFKPTGPCLNSIVTGQKDLHVSKAIQKAVIEVNEYGTRAAAASVMGVVPVALHITKAFNANKPFYYVVQIKREILFSGVFNVLEAVALSLLETSNTTFVADHPFFYMVKAKQEVIFSGVYEVD